MPQQRVNCQYCLLDGNTNTKQPAALLSEALCATAAGYCSYSVLGVKTNIIQPGALLSEAVFTTAECKVKLG